MDKKTQKTYIIISVIIILAIVTPIYYWFDPSQYTFMPKCVFKTFLHIECPSCGIQRALHALLHGRLSESISYNPFLLISIPIVAAICVNELIINWSQPTKRSIMLGKVCKWLIYVYIFLYFAWFLFRNL